MIPSNTATLASHLSCLSGEEIDRLVRILNYVSTTRLATSDCDHLLDPTNQADDTEIYWKLRKGD